MGRIEKTVFISYRRTSAPWALAIFQNLTHHGYDVFFDYNGVASGDFGRVILGNINARAHFIVLLTPSALDRCKEPGDWLRREIEAAISVQRNIVPLMLDGFDFGQPEIAGQLTGALAALGDYSALRVYAEYFAEAMVHLRERYLNVPLDAVLHPLSLVAQQAAKDGQAAAGTAREIQKKELTAQELVQGGLKAIDLKDDVQSGSWFLQAAEAGNAFGITNLAVMYENGLPKDDAQAVTWYRKAADAGNAFGMRHLGFMYESGRGGLPKDDAQAVTWYRKAAHLGDTYAQQALKRLGQQ